MQKYILSILLFLSFIPFSFAEEPKKSPVKITIKSESDDISIGDSFNYLADYTSGEIPNSFKYINLNFNGVNKGSKLYSSLQKLVYLDLIENKSVRVNQNKNISAYNFYALSNRILNVNFISNENSESLKNRNANKSDFSKIKSHIDNILIDFDDINSENRLINLKRDIFIDVYDSIINDHYDHDNIDEVKLVESAIDGLVKGSNDNYTVYFPPTDSKNFYESLSGEYEGIGAYVDMELPGVLKIVSPIPGSPAEKSGLKGGDIIIKVDDRDVTKNNSLLEVVSWIKGKAGSTVLLTISRKNKILEIEVERAKIVIKDVEYSLLNSKTFLIEMKSFGEKSSSAFREAIVELQNNKSVNRIIIDLRNNGGGYLGEVSNILGHFVPEGELTALVKYQKNDQGYYSAGYDLIDFSKYKIILLQNSGTASASEIMIGTIKDYMPSAIVLGEKSYGKGSVQTIKKYQDGSSLKYTIAKWFTGKSETGIDGVGITPDIDLEFNLDRYKKYKIDNQLEKAKTLY